ncbi:Acetylornithine/succinyldiaminopimelate aminotransferase [Streptomyces alboniger]
MADYPNRFDPAALGELPERLQSTVKRRNNVLGPGYALNYREPVEFVPGRGAHLFDRDGNDYLDAYNNVPCVGHAHPHVVEAVSRQMAAVNTNTRYVQESLVDYAERLLATMPEALARVSFACSGSEANDLAVRVARFHTGGEGIVVTRWAYHGLTREVASFSPTLGAGSPLGPNVRLIDAPDPRLVPPGSSLPDYMRVGASTSSSATARACGADHRLCALKRWHLHRSRRLPARHSRGGARRGWRLHRDPSFSTSSQI